MGKRIIFSDADFSVNGMKLVVNKSWVFELIYQKLNAESSSPLNKDGVIVYDSDNCKKSELLQRHIKKVRFDAIESGKLQILRVDKNDYSNYEVVHEIECAIGNDQEAEVDIYIGENYYLGIKNGSSRNILKYHNETSDYGTGFKFILGSNALDFPNSVIRIDFQTETESWE